MFPITIPQQNIWNLQKYYSKSSISNICGMLVFEERHNPKLLAEAVNAFVKNQEGMRLRFMEKGKEVFQYAVPYEWVEIPKLHFDDLNEAEKFFEQEGKKLFPMTESAMYRFFVFDTPEESGVCLCLSHLISDAFTLSLFCRRIIEYLQNPDVETEHNIASYLDFVQAETDYLKSERFQKDSLYWSKRFSEKPSASHIKPECAESISAEAKRITKQINAKETARLKTWCDKNQVSLAVLFEAAVFAYLYRMNESPKETMIGSFVLNRATRHEKETAGMFISTMPLCVSVSGEDTPQSLCEKISAAHKELFRRQKYPYAQILKTVRETFDFSGGLFDVAVSYQNAVIGCGKEFSYHTKWFPNGYSEIPLALHIDDREESGCLTINMDYQTEVFGADEAELLYERLYAILLQLTGEKNCSVGEMSVMSQAEYQKVMFDFNDTAVDYPKDKCVHELFCEQVKKTPNKVALVFEERGFTYRQLDEMSNALAHTLRDMGIKPNDIVPIIAKRSWYVIVSMLGVLKAGGAYMPVSPSYPTDRIEYMMHIAKAELAVTYGYEGYVSVKCLPLETFDFSSYTDSVDNWNKPEDICYVIFTSGSTGKPKGVCIKHENLTNYCDNNHNSVCYRLIKTDCESIVSVTSIIFDIFVTESILPLLNGIVVHFASEIESVSQTKLSKLFLNYRIDVIQTTPSKMYSYIRDKKNLDYLKKVKVIILGGEAFPERLLFELKNYTKAKILNIYGPAETTVWSTNKNLQISDITIGKPIANTQIYILDQNKRPLPIGIAGELCIAGDGVGKGYLNQPKLTAERFLPNPFASEKNHHGKIMYRSGDLARFRTDGEIEYLGRIDTQVKIRGLRIELGEIESVLHSYPGIHLTAAAEKRDKKNRQYLVGYYLSDQEIDEKLLRQHLLEKLPAYMVPNFFLHLTQMPMTASGKIDRKNLPMPAMTESIETYEAPVTDTEWKLAGIWKDLLGTEKIGRNSDFISCGGDSLEAIHMLAEIERIFGLSVEMNLILEHTALSDLADCIDRIGESAAQIPSLHASEYPLTPQQKAIYLACRKNPASLVYNMPMFVRLSRGTDKKQVKQRILCSYRRHSILRTRISRKGEELIGVIDCDAPLQFEEFQDKNEFFRPFDLSKAPLMRIGFGCGGMAIDMHHIVADGESLRLIVDEIFYGKESEEPVSYADYAVYFQKKLESGGFDRHKNFFQKFLPTEIDPLKLPEISGTKDVGAAYTHTLSCETAELVRKYAKTNGLTETGVYLVLYGMLLSGFSNTQQIVTSIVLANRAYAKTQHVCGMFVNTIPLALDHNPKITFGAYTKQVYQTLLDLYQYQELPYFEICKAAGIADINAVNTTFVYQPGELEIEGIDFEYFDTKTHKMDLSFQVIPKPDGSCKICMEYNGGKYASALMERLAEGYETLIRQIDRERTLKEFSLMGEEEFHRIVYKFNSAAETANTGDICAHTLFAQAAEAYSQKICLTQTSETYAITYRKLDKMSNALAHALRRRGIRPNDIVPVLAKRSFLAVAAMLGIWKAGGAYMPVDTEAPAERIGYMLTEAKSSLALTYGFKGAMPVPCVDLSKFDYGADTAPLVSVNTPEDVCYVIFTSGSTGKPKGVLLKHGGLVRFVCGESAFHRAVSKQCSRALAVGSFAFDISIVELFLPLQNGQGIVIADEKTIQSPKAMAEAIVRYDIDLLHTTPTRLGYYLEHTDFQKAVSRLKVILSAGEAFSPELYAKLRKATDAELFNGYGPTETTVGCSFAKVTDADAVTIGKPMSGVQMYILDFNGRPCPIGVPGELCIAGTGVAKGYLNRPKLTAEKFVPNPFQKGAVMYRSGDLARWRTDGEIEYLGRIDPQVKIRGLRIELGEIETVLSAYPEILASVVTDGREKNGRQYLIGYYTSKKPIEEQHLRQYLAAKLPRYMVPNYFMRLSNMPVTISGKIDRKNLPAPTISAGDSNYESPGNDTEQLLCEIAKKVLGMESIGIRDDFFALGGDSLKAMEYAAEAYEHGLSFELQAVFEYPTAAGLARYLAENGKKPETILKQDFEKYRSVLKTRKDMHRAFGNILLTGATGYLGAHILDVLQKQQTGNIYCLVRGNTPEDSRNRLIKTLWRYFGNTYDSFIGTRIFPVTGDITDDALLDCLPKDVQTVIHAAADVRHYGSYDAFSSVNIEGTRHMLSYAEKTGARFFYISTLSVGGMCLTEQGEGDEVFSEEDLYIGQDLSNVYLRSKFEAECLVLDARMSGADASIFRIGNLTNRYSDGVFQPNYAENAFLNRMKTFLDFKCYPSDLSELTVEFSPVDCTAEAIVRLASDTGTSYAVFHVNHSDSISYETLAAMLRELGIDIQKASMDAFLQMISSSHDAAYDSVKNELHEMNFVKDHIRVVTDSKRTNHMLYAAGFRWPEITTEYIRQYVQYFEKLQFWKR